MTACQVDGCDRSATAQWSRDSLESKTWSVCSAHQLELQSAPSEEGFEGRLRVGAASPYEIVRLEVDGGHGATARIRLGLGRDGVEVEHVEFVAGLNEVLSLCSIVSGSVHPDIVSATA